MAFRFFGSNSIGSGVRITVADTDEIVIGEGVNIVSDTGTAVSGSGLSSATVGVSVDGLVASNGLGISLSTSDTTAGRLSVYVGSSGKVISDNNAININAGDVSVINTGEIRGLATTSTTVILSGFDSKTLNNEGTIFASSGAFAAVGFNFGVAEGLLVNRGAILTDSSSAGRAFFGTAQSVGVSPSTGVDTIFNSGLIQGLVEFRSGNDVYVGTGGQTIGRIDGGTGDDQIIGGSFADEIYDLNGANWLVGAGGDDTVTISFDVLTDVAYGGLANGFDDSGNDSLIFSGGIGVNIFLGVGYVSTVPVGDQLVAWIQGFENATGGFGADGMIGSEGNNILDGDDGADAFVGGGGADTFRFRDWQHIDAGEQIFDFDVTEGDRIDLSQIDADFAALGNQSFTFNTVRTSALAGELVFTNYGAGGQLDLYVDANDTIDATLFISYGDAALTPPTIESFIL